MNSRQLTRVAENGRGTAPVGKEPKSAEKVFGSQSIERALGVLRCFGTGRSEFTLSEISRALDLNTSTAHRIVRTLVRHGFLTQSSRTGGYRLGGVMVLLGEVAHQNSGLDRVVSILEEIAGKYGETVSLGIREGNTVGVLRRIVSSRELRFSQSIGVRVPLHASAMGKAILFGSSDLEADLARMQPLLALTPQTIVSPDEIIREIDISKKRGYTTDLEEQFAGVRCIGAPIRDSEGVVFAALAIQAPSAHFSDDRIRQIGSEIWEFAERAARAMNL